MSDTPKKRPNWWAGMLAFLFLLPIGTLSFESFTSAVILAIVGGAVGAFLFPARAT